MDDVDKVTSNKTADQKLMWKKNRNAGPAKLRALSPLL
jgi:hypothetical protein